MEKQSEVEQYWQNKEQELGEPILMKSLSHTYYRGIQDTYGILYSSASYLVYEYSKKGRKSILESLFSRPGGGELTENVTFARKDIRRSALVNSGMARSWIRKALGPAEVLERLKGTRPNPVIDALIGTVLCVCTNTDYIVFDTPENRQWREYLQTAVEK